MIWFTHNSRIYGISTNMREKLKLMGTIFVIANTASGGYQNIKITTNRSKNNAIQMYFMILEKKPNHIR